MSNIIENAAFPMLGALKEQTAFMQDGLLQGGFLFRLISGDARLLDNTVSDLHFLALTFALIGGLSIILMSKMRKPSTIAAWLFIVFALIVGPHQTTGGKLFFYPLAEANGGQPIATNTVEQRDAALGRPTPTATDGEETNVFTPQLATIDFISRIHRAIYAGLFDDSSGKPRLRNRRDEMYKGLVFSSMPHLTLDYRPDLQQSVMLFQRMCDRNKEFLTLAPYDPNIWSNNSHPAVLSERPLLLSLEEHNAMAKTFFTLGGVHDAMLLNAANYNNTPYPVYPPYAVTYADQAHAESILVRGLLPTMASSDGDEIARTATIGYVDKYKKLEDNFYNYSKFYIPWEEINITQTEEAQAVTNAGHDASIKGKVGTNGLSYTTNTTRRGKRTTSTNDPVEHRLAKKGAIERDDHAKMAKFVEENNLEAIPVGLGLNSATPEEMERAYKSFTDDKKGLAEVIGSSIGGAAAALLLLATPIGWASLTLAALVTTGGVLLGGALGGGIYDLSDGTPDAQSSSYEVVHNCAQLHRSIYMNSQAGFIALSGLISDTRSDQLSSTNLAAYASHPRGFLQQYETEDRGSQGAFRDQFDTLVNEYGDGNGALNGPAADAVRLSLLSHMMQAGLARTIWPPMKDVGSLYVRDGMERQASAATINEHTGNNDVAEGLGIIGTALVEVGTYIGSFFTGIGAVTYVEFLRKIIGIIMLFILSATPLVFLIGLMIPSYAPGMLALAIGGVAVLSTVPITFTVIDASLSILRNVIESDKGVLYSGIDAALLDYVAAAAYTGIVGATMFMIFKSGDASSLQYLGKADQYANKFGDAAETAAKSIGIAAASIGTAGVAAGGNALLKGKGVKGALLAAKQQGGEVFASTSTNVPIVGQILKEASPASAAREGVAYVDAVEKNRKEGESTFAAANRIKTQALMQTARNRYAGEIAQSDAYEDEPDASFDRVKQQQKSRRSFTLKNNSHGEAVPDFHVSTTDGLMMPDGAGSDVESDLYKAINRDLNISKGQDKTVDNTIAQKETTKLFVSAVKEAREAGNKFIKNEVRTGTVESKTTGKQVASNIYGYILDTNNGKNAHANTALEKLQSVKDPKTITRNDNGTYFIETSQIAQEDIVGSKQSMAIAEATPPQKEQARPTVAKRERMFPSRLPKNKRDA